MQFNRIFLSLIFLAGCSLNSVEDFSCAAEGVCRSICKELEKIESREDFSKAAPKLQKYFNDLVAIIISMRQFQEKYPEEGEYIVSEKWYSVKMQSELERIYGIEGGRIMIEKAEKEALLKLDAYEKNVKKQKNFAPRKSV